MYPMRASCTQVAGTLASDVLEADRAGVPWRSRVRVHVTGSICRSSGSKSGPKSGQHFKEAIKDVFIQVELIV